MVMNQQNPTTSQPLEPSVPPGLYWSLRALIMCTNLSNQTSVLPPFQEGPISSPVLCLAALLCRSTVENASAGGWGWRWRCTMKRVNRLLAGRENWSAPQHSHRSRLFSGETAVEKSTIMPTLRSTKISGITVIM